LLKGKEISLARATIPCDVSNSHALGPSAVHRYKITAQALDSEPLVWLPPHTSLQQVGSSAAELRWLGLPSLYHRGAAESVRKRWKRV